MSGGYRNEVALLYYASHDSGYESGVKLKAVFCEACDHFGA